MDEKGRGRAKQALFRSGAVAIVHRPEKQSLAASAKPEMLATAPEMASCGEQSEVSTDMLMRRATHPSEYS